MERARGNEANAHYNDEIIFLDGLIEFHPEVYDNLSPEDQKILATYYLIGQNTPDNIFTYRQQLVAQDTEIEDRAKEVFNKILTTIGTSFTYSTKADQ